MPKKFIGYDLVKPTQITGEKHVIIDNKICLDYIPQQGSVFIKGFVEHDNPETLPVNGFYIDYKTDDKYLSCSGVVQFYINHNGTEVTADYKAIGTIFHAEDWNELIDLTEENIKTSGEYKKEVAKLQNNIVAVRTEAQAGLKAHSESEGAHADIRNALDNEIRERKEALNAEIATRVAAVTTETNARIAADAAEAEARAQAIQTEANARQSADTVLSGKVDALTTRVGTNETNISLLSDELTEVKGEVLDDIQDKLDEIEAKIGDAVKIVSEDESITAPTGLKVVITGVSDIA